MVKSSVSDEKRTLALRGNHSEFRLLRTSCISARLVNPTAAFPYLQFSGVNHTMEGQLGAIV